MFRVALSSDVAAETTTTLCMTGHQFVARDYILGAADTFASPSRITAAHRARFSIKYSQSSKSFSDKINQIWHRPHYAAWNMAVNALSD